MSIFSYPPTSVAFPPGLATEAKQDVIITDLQEIEADIEAGNAILTSIDGKDFATQTTLDALLTAFNAEDFATQTTLAAVLADLQLKADLTETQPVSLASQPLPTGASTEAKQDDVITGLSNIEADVESGNALLTSIDADTSTIAGDTTSIDAKITAVDTGNVTVASSALPTGAATSANQATGNSSLSNIESDINSLNARLAGNLVPETFDYLSLTYVAAGNGAGEIETVVYRTGGAAGTIVATLTLGYDASNRLTSVTRS